MYLMNPDLTFGRERMRTGVRRAELARLVAEARRAREPLAHSVEVPALPVAALACEPCREPAAA